MQRIQSAYNMKTNRKYAVGESITIHGIANPAANLYKISKIYFSRNKRLILMKGRHYGSNLPTVRIVGELKDVKIKHEKVKYMKGKNRMKIGEAKQQGEVYIRCIEKPEDLAELAPVTRTDKGFILSHSESGNHHLLTDGELLERPKRAGMDCFYAILKEPQKVIQDAGNPHETIDLPEGFYDIRISREYDPFTQQARRVAD